MADPAEEQLQKYKAHCELLRQIHSDRALYYKGLDVIYNTILIVTAAATTFLGFMGVEKVRKILFSTWQDVSFEFVFNLSVLVILILTILNLIFRFQEQASKHDRGIFALTNLIQELDDIIHLGIHTGQESITVERCRMRYASITENLPPTTDRQFLKGKAHLQVKKRLSSEIEKKSAP